ncbi:hypothetical protein OG592_41195 (plasmid) [Streptomyces avidinii]|uniref:hypothetical protein n=1 Tax=Streptomyces avidinii TaxID=1895 RepID=UPI002F91603C|nr:hypothetical protein OG592_41195 [Streptomyces avidinii]
MTQNRQQDRRTAASLLGGAAVLAVMAGGTDTAPLAYLAAGLLIGAVLVYRRTVEPRPYTSWPSWLAGAAVALLLAWVGDEAQRLVLPPLAGIDVIVALVMAVLWRRRRTGRGDWLVWVPETNTVLRREWHRRAAIHWAEGYGKRCAVSPVESFADDSFPEAAVAVPLYPHRDRPTVAVLPPLGQQ